MPYAAGTAFRQRNQQLLRKYQESLQKGDTRDADESILVTAVYTNPSDNRGLAQDKLRPVLEPVVDEVIACALYACSIRMNLSQFPVIEAIPQVASLTQVTAVTRSGSVVSQGVEGLRVDELRSSTFGSSLTGQGITIGVISDSFDNSNSNLATSAASDVATGDLPPNVNILDDTITASDEGRAMLQILHDMVPDTSLVFHTGAAGEAAFSSAVAALVNAGCDIIVDDIGFPIEEPFFSDGIAAQAVNDAVVNDGVAYFTAAGNSGVASYEASFQPSGVTNIIPNCDFHDFSGSGDIFQQITVDDDNTLIVLQWDDPFSAVHENASPDSDLDFYAFSPGASNSNPIASSGNIQVPGGTAPVESLLLNAGTYDIGFCLFTGPSPGKVKWVAYGGGISSVEHDTQSSTLVGHPNAEFGAAVASASCQQGVPCFTASPPLVNVDSSRGGTQIRIDDNGNNLGVPVDRVQPRFTATDGIQTTFFQVPIGNNFFFFGKSSCQSN